MKAEIKIKHGGGKVTLAMPIGGLEKLAEIDGLTEYPIELLQAFRVGLWKASEVRAVLSVGLDCGGSGVDLSALEAEHSTGALRNYAEALLEAALKDDSGNFNAAAFPALSGSASKPAPTS